MKFFKNLTTKKKLKEKFIFLFKNGKINDKKKSIILTEFGNASFNHIASAYLCDVISEKHNAKIVELIINLVISFRAFFGLPCNS